MNRMNIFLLAASSLVASPIANAATIFVAEVPSVQTWPNGAAVLEFHHGINPSRAWVSASFCGKLISGDSENSDCRRYNQHDFHVRGLVYDRSSGAIRLGPYVCAWAEPGVLRPVDRQTGECQLNVHTVRQDDAEGFQSRWHWVDVINIRLR